jgi:hypothetical protein
MYRDDHVQARAPTAGDVQLLVIERLEVALDVYTLLGVVPAPPELDDPPLPLAPAPPAEPVVGSPVVPDLLPLAAGLPLPVVPPVPVAVPVPVPVPVVPGVVVVVDPVPLVPVGEVLVPVPGVVEPLVPPPEAVVVPLPDPLAVDPLPVLEVPRLGPDS